MKEVKKPENKYEAASYFVRCERLFGQDHLLCFLAWKTGVSTVVESCLRETTKIMMKTKMGA